MSELCRASRWRAVFSRIMMSSMLFSRAVVAGERARKRPAVSTSAQAASMLDPVKSSSRDLSARKATPAGKAWNLSSSPGGERGMCGGE